MIKFYTNQELSKSFGINLARWKRWSREFLPPDPLGGLQSGYARQYNADQAFTVYLGGFLVDDLRFSIPQARSILIDLHDWLVMHRFFTGFRRLEPSDEENSHDVEYYQIAICRSDADRSADAKFSYIARGIISSTPAQAGNMAVCEERFIESSMPPEKKATCIKTAASYRVLNISILRERFLNLLNGPGMLR